MCVVTGFGQMKRGFNKSRLRVANVPSPPPHLFFCTVDSLSELVWVVPRTQAVQSGTGGSTVN